MFVLAKYLTSSADAALVAATLFTLAPYRIEHFMHLELQWTAWMPLTFWAVHRTFEGGSIRHGLLAGALLVLQAISCLYYGVYLAIVASVLAALLGATRPRVAAGAAGRLAVGAAIAAVALVPYIWPYVENARLLGPRDPGEIANFSAQLASYVAAPQQNWFWGWTGQRFSGNELRVFPGAVAVTLALLGLAQRPRRLAWIYAGLTALAVEMSLGLNGWLYSWLVAHVWALRGFRAPARFAILASCCLALVAAFGFQRLEQLAPARVKRVLFAAVLVAIALDTGSISLPSTGISADVPSVYRMLARMDPAVVIELPIADWGASPVYMFWSTRHWKPLVNGYSGYIPPDYDETVARMRTFPDAASLARLEQLDVRYIVVHESFYKRAEYTNLMLRLARLPQVVGVGRFSDWSGGAQLFKFRPDAARVDPLQRASSGAS